MWNLLWLQKVCYAREYATPAITLHEMANTIPFSGLSKEAMNEQAAEFSNLVTKVIHDEKFKREVQNLEDKCVMVYFDGKWLTSEQLIWKCNNWATTWEHGTLGYVKNVDLLFISYNFVKGFSAITFSFLLISSWNFHDVCQRFLYDQKQNFSWIRQKMRNFPIDPHYKNHPLL